MSIAGRQVLFISYNGMLDPLGQSQVIPYLRELAGQGVKYSLLSFERPATFSPAGQLKCQELKKSLADYKRVKKFTLREDDFPKTTTRKIKRFAVEADVST